MHNCDLFFGLNSEQVKQIQEKYALLTPFLDECISPADLRLYRKMVCEKLQISKRTLRRYVHNLRKKGISSLIRKKRSDAGNYRVFAEVLLDKSLSLLKENPFRTIPKLMDLLELDEECADLVKNISPMTLYHHLKNAGVDFQKKYNVNDSKIYHQFEADYPNQLWQGDARHGIPLPHPNKKGKTKMTYLFAWIDDFSRKIMFARYYWDEKLPRMEDSFRQAVLRWGLPEKLYCDNGRVYISAHFLFVVTDLGVRKIHHPAYSAWCKGKIEVGMKLIKSFQREAMTAGFQTLEELNSALWAWIDVKYHNKIHSTTGETPGDRFRNNINKNPPKRIKDIEEFNSLFLWRKTRTVTKYGRVSIETNQYAVRGISPKSVVEVRYNPFDLTEVLVFHKGKFLQKAKANVLKVKQVKNMPEERPTNNVSKASQDYFTKLREEHNKQKQDEISRIRYSDLNKEENK